MLFGKLCRDFLAFAPGECGSQQRKAILKLRSRQGFTICAFH